MKLKYFALSAVVALFGLSSCEDDNTGGGSLAPVVILDGTNDFISGDATVDAGSDINFRLTASENPVSGTNLRRLTINRVFNNTPVLVLDTLINGSSFGPLELNTNSRSEAGDENFIFEVTDRDDEVGNVTLTISTTIANPFVEQTDTMFHFSGPRRGAYDLLAGAKVSKNESDNIKDMMNTDDALDFSGSWESLNGTQFRLVRRNGNNQTGVTFDYATADAASAMTAFNNNLNVTNPVTTTINNPLAGDVYVFRLRGQDNFGAMQIGTINRAQGTNNGNIIFNFKR